MYASNDRGATREVFFRAWRNHLDGKPLEGIERLLVQVALKHPEYHSFLADPESHRDRDYNGVSGQANPFLHMGLHVAIEEQLTLDEPRGIRDIYRSLLLRNADEHAVQHHIMECLGQWIYRAQRQNAAPDASEYLECLMRLKTEK
jgi:hypothetical protein